MAVTKRLSVVALAGMLLGTLIMPQGYAGDADMLANLSPETPVESLPVAPAQPESPKAKVVALLLQSFHGNTDFEALSQALSDGHASEGKVASASKARAAASVSSQNLVTDAQVDEKPDLK